MAVEVSNAPLRGKLVVTNIGLMLSGDLSAPIIEADAIVAVDGRITAIAPAISTSRSPRFRSTPRARPSRRASSTATATPSSETGRHGRTSSAGSRWA
jgi:hypothetical protein